MFKLALEIWWIDGTLRSVAPDISVWVVNWFICSVEAIITLLFEQIEGTCSKDDVVPPFKERFL